MKINQLTNIKHINVKTAFIDSNSNLIAFKNNKMFLDKPNFISINEQKNIISALKKQNSTKKWICTGILENQVSFLRNGVERHFDFDEVELSYDDLLSLERNECTQLSTFEHKALKPIILKPAPLFLSDLNEIFIIMREVTSTQIKTRKNRMGKKLNTNFSKNSTRKHMKHV
jgi:hypothetical protein